MQLNMSIDLHDGNGPQEVRTTLYAMVQWERKFNVKIAELSERLGIEDIAFIAYETLASLNRPRPSTFEDFIKKNPDIQVIGAGDDPPTQGAVTDAS